MTRERWQQVEVILGAALDLEPSARAPYLDTACGADAELRREVESLLAQEGDAPGVLSAAVGQAAESLSPLGPAVNAGQRIGAYRVLNEIGHGGMGAVYLADRADDEFSKKVAIKVVQRGMVSDYTLARFRHERQILAGLEHPNIARMLDGGTTEDGVPYVVMEFIDGLQIVDFCAARQLGAEDRLRLFQMVCSAVQYAHKNLIVHRDLKPANILVTPDGIPKLLDFGLAKLVDTDPNTRAEALTGVFRVMTPEYASPEQVTGSPITTASDVYSLGAVLYEMLAGRRPHELGDYSPAELHRAICERETRPPSETTSALAADLDNIVLKAMQKEPERRYSSAEQFSEDIGRYLAGRPVLARQDTLVYRATKFVRRNKLSVAAAAMIAVSLAGGALLSAYQARRAERRFQQVRKLANSFLFDFHDAIKEIPGATRARQLVVKTALEYLDSLAAEARGDASLQRELAEAYLRVGEVQGNVTGASLGDTNAALASYRKALAISEEVQRSHPRDTAAGRLFVRLSTLVGEAQTRTGDTKGALAHYEKGSAAAERLCALEPDNRENQQALARILRARAREERDITRSIELTARAAAVLEKIAGPWAADDDVWSELADTYSAQGSALGIANRLQEAVEPYSKNLEIRKRILQHQPNQVTPLRQLMIAHSHVGDTLGSPTLPNLGDPKGALEQYREMLRIAEYLYRADPANGRALADYGIAQMRVANVMVEDSPAQSVDLFRGALETLERQSAADSGNSRTLLNIAFVYGRIADSLAKTGDDSGALHNYQRGLAVGEPVAAKDPKDLRIRPTIAGLHQGILPVLARRRQASAVEHHCMAGLKVSAEMAALGAGSMRSLVSKPRTLAACGDAYAALAQWERSAEYYRTSQSGWRELSIRPGFEQANRSEMERVTVELERAGQRARGAR